MKRNPLEKDYSSSRLPATEAQLDRMRKYGLDIPENCTRGQASRSVGRSIKMRNAAARLSGRANPWRPPEENHEWKVNRTFNARIK